MAPLMGWVKRLADHVIQDRLGEGDLEFAWGDPRPADPAVQAKLLDTYVRDGIYAINEARDLLGLDPVPGGDRPMVYGTQGATPLGMPPAAEIAGTALLRKYNPDVEAEPRVPAGAPDGGQWTGDGADGNFEIAARGDLPCQGYCQSGGSYRTSAMYNIGGKNVCRDCAVKMMGLGGLPGLRTDKGAGTIPYSPVTGNTSMSDRTTALRGLAVGDMFHGRSPNGASLICLVTAVTENAICARRVTTQDNIQFDRDSGIELGDIPSRIDCVAPLPWDVYDVFLNLDRKYRTFQKMDKSGAEPDFSRYRLTPEEHRALLVIDEHVSANPI